MMLSPHICVLCTLADEMGAHILFALPLFTIYLGSFLTYSSFLMGNAL